MRVNYEINSMKNKRESDAKLSKTLERLKSEMHTELDRRSNAIRAEYEQRLANELRERERQMKEKFESEYESRVQMEIRKKSAEMERKKAVLEKHIMEQAKKLFN